MRIIFYFWIRRFQYWRSIILSWPVTETVDWLLKSYWENIKIKRCVPVEQVNRSFTYKTKLIVSLVDSPLTNFIKSATAVLNFNEKLNPVQVRKSHKYSIKYSVVGCRTSNSTNIIGMLSLHGKRRRHCQNTDRVVSFCYI